MPLSRLLLIFSIATVIHPAVLQYTCNNFQNGRNYSAYEYMLLANESNLIELENGFYPTNYHSSIVLDVNYHFILTTSADTEEKQHKEMEIDFNLGESSIQDGIEMWNQSHKTLNYSFRWTVSPINLYIRPGLLTSLSLNAYQTRHSSIDLHLGLPLNCSPECLNETLASSSSICKNPPVFLQQLNNFTANVRFQKQIALTGTRYT